eukprot:gene14061-14179_t
MLSHEKLLRSIKTHAMPFSGLPSDYGAIAELIGNARFVLIGEATHGTQEFYEIRAKLTQILIQHHGFDAVAVEGDWPDCYSANQYVRGADMIQTAEEALSGFRRFPSWMWRNLVVVEFLDWLRLYNHSLQHLPERVGFYGMDLYSLSASIEAVVSYLEKIDPAGAELARHHYGCFDHYYALNPQEYGMRSFSGVIKSCEDDVVRQLAALRQHAHDYLKRDGFAFGEDLFCTEQNAKVVVRAEEYYRTMFSNRVSSWNLRDSHMMETLNSIATHISNQRGRDAKIIVWAHNSHVGNARATEMSEKGEFNIGQLMRDQYGDRDTRLIGFSTYSGTVTAASKWDGEAEYKTVRPAMSESYEGLFHDAAIPDFFLDVRDGDALNRYLRLSRLQRAIGVLYLPETERRSHYFYSRLPDQFDIIIHIDKTTALKPLERTALWHKGEVFETYPSGL